MEKITISKIFKILIALGAAVGILLQCGVGSGNFTLSSFRMFTTLSNLAVLIYFVVAVIMLTHENKGRRNFLILAKSKTVQTVLPTIKFAVTMAIILTAVVAQVMLRGTFSNLELLPWIGIIILHYGVPIATVLDYFIFDEKGLTTWKMPLISTIFPLVYLGASMFGARFISDAATKYPYPFMNIDSLGIKMVGINIGIITVGFLIVAYLAFLLDRVIGRRR